MSGESAKAGMSSLVMQAAKRAAQADGVVSSAAASAVTSASKAAVAVGSSSGMSKASACALQQARSAIANTNPSAAQQQQGQAPQAQAQPQQQPPPPTKKSTKGPPLRRGKWTPEEEAYANRLIQEFKAGLLPLTDGTTLRTFLSKLLNCDPMRISKKFVGSNCIGKQVFRRRNADLNRLTPEQIQQSRAELSELERRFLERVAQTNRVKTSVGGGGAAAAAAGAAAAAAAMKKDEEAALAEQHHHHHQQQHQQQPPSPPWLQPPLGYKHGMGASMAAGPNSRAAAAGRALLEGAASSSMRDALERTASRSGLAAGLHHASRGATTGSRSSISSSTTDAATNLLVAELQKQQQRASQQNLLNALNSSNNLFAVSRSGSASALSGLSSNALSQLARKASVSGLASNPSISNLMLKTGLSRDQLSQLARERGLSSTGSIPNMMQRQSSFDALMSLDFQSLQSIDNLANLMQTGSVSSSQLPETGLKNADFGSSSSRQNLAAAAAAAASSSSDLSTAARRLASAGRLESLLQSISSNNVRDVPAGVVFATAPVATGSNANLNNLLQSMQGNASAANLLGAANGQSAVSLADLLRQDSSTGLTALRFQDGLLNQRNSSVDDFLSLVAAGDIPLEHQDPSLLNIPLMQQQLGGSASQQQQDAAAQLLQQASGNSSLVNALASRSLSNLQQASGGGTGSSGHLSASALAMAQARQHRLAGSKRSLEDLAGELNGQGNVKKRS